MDINALTNTNLLYTQTNINREEAKTEGFAKALETAMEDKDEKELRKACFEFESYFLHVMLKEMRKSVDSINNTKSNAQNIFQDMLDEEYASAAAGTGGVGLADMMYKQLSKRM